MECDDDRCGNSEDYVIIQPVFRAAPSREPRDPLANWVDEDSAEDRNTEKSEFKPNGPAWTQDVVLSRKWTVRSAEQVVIPPVSGNRDDKSDCKQPPDYEANSMTSFRIYRLSDIVPYRCLNAQFFVPPIATSVLTENRL